MCAQAETNLVPAQSYAAVLLVVAIAMTSSLAIFYVGRGSSNMNQLPISVSDASLKLQNDGTMLLSMNVRNEGLPRSSLSARIDNQSFFVPATAFASQTITQGQSSNYRARVQSIGLFDGMTGSIRVPNTPSLNSSRFSVELGFSTSSFTPDSQMLVSKGASGGNSFYFFSYRSLNVFNDFVVYENNTRYDQQLGDIFALHAWYDVVLTLDGSSITAYVNGYLVQSWARTILFQGNTNDFLIGNCVCGGYYFDGSIAFVRFYDRSIGADEVLRNFQDSMNPVQNGLTTWLAFNATNSGTIIDLSGHGNSGAVVGGVVVTSPVVVGGTYLLTIIATDSAGRKFSTSTTITAY